MPNLSPEKGRTCGRTAGTYMLEDALCGCHKAAVGASSSRKKPVAPQVHQKSIRRLREAGADGASPANMLQQEGGEGGGYLTRNTSRGKQTAVAVTPSATKPGIRMWPSLRGRERGGKGGQGSREGFRWRLHGTRAGRVTPAIAPAVKRATFFMRSLFSALDCLSASF